jgi:hypothetical protein
MEKNFILKQIDCIRDVKNHLWTGLIVTLGGTLTLLFNLNTNLKLVFFFIGLFFSIIFFVAYFKKDDQLEFFFNKLNGGK